MKFAPQLRSWWRSLFARTERDREMRDEFAFHLEEYASELERRGVARSGTISLAS